MPTKGYALDKNGPKRIVLSWTGFFDTLVVQFDNKDIVKFSNRETLKAGKEYQLPDGSLLKIQLVGFELRLLRDEEPLPGSASDPAQKIKGASMWFYFIAFVTLFHSIRFLQLDGLRWGNSIGLAITQIVDGSAIKTAANDAASIYPQALAVAKIIAFSLDVGIVSIFIVLAILATRTLRWDFIVGGMILYTLDGFILLRNGVFYDVFAHGFILILLYRMLSSSRKLVRAA